MLAVLDRRTPGEDSVPEDGGGGEDTEDKEWPAAEDGRPAALSRLRLAIRYEQKQVLFSGSTAETSARAGGLACVRICMCAWKRAGWLADGWTAICACATCKRRFRRKQTQQNGNLVIVIKKARRF